MNSLDISITCPLCARAGCNVYKFASGEIGMQRHYIGYSRQPCLVKRNDPQVIAAYEEARLKRERYSAIENVKHALAYIGRLPSSACARESWLTILYGDPLDPALAETKRKLSDAYERTTYADRYYRAPYNASEYRQEIAAMPQVIVALFRPVFQFLASPEFWVYVLLNEAQRGDGDANAPPLNT